MHPADRPADYRRTVIRLCMLLVLPLSGCHVPAAQGPADSFGLDLSLPSGARTDGAVIFLIDGVSAEVFHDMLDAGELPAMRKYFVNRGLYAPRAVANTPAVTLANLVSVATGLFPGHHGVTGINWFDRNCLVWRDYETIGQKNSVDGDYQVANIYEQFPDRTTVSVFFQPHRQATKFIENWISAGPPFCFRWYEFVDRLTLYRLNLVADLARKQEGWPAVTVVYLLAPDFRAYATGIMSQEYRRSLRHSDYQIGRVCGDLEKAGLLDKLHIVLVSDHGMGEVTRHLRMNDSIRKAGIVLADRRLCEQTPFEKRLDYYDKYQAVSYGSGDRYWALCLRKPIFDEEGRLVGHHPWPVRPSAEDLSSYPAGDGSRRIDLIELILSQEAVDAVAYSLAPGRVRLVRKTGQVEFAQDDGPSGPISYRQVSGDDPLGWRGKVADPLLNGQPASSRDWLGQTVSTGYPDLPAQIVAYFRARRAGDLAVFAAPGWDFSRHHRAGHGGLRPEDMFVPLLIAGPGVEPGEIQAARTVDVMPTVLSLLGRAVPEGLDGEPLVHPATPAPR